MKNIRQKERKDKDMTGKGIKNREIIKEKLNKLGGKEIRKTVKEKKEELKQKKTKEK